jgi:uncharacterized protein
MAALESQFSAPLTATASDTLAPAKVMNLQFTVAQGQVNLSWDAVTTNADGSAIADLAGYRIYRKNDAADTFAAIGSVDASTTTYIDTTMEDGASYIYAISAYDDEATPNEGEMSDNVAVKTVPSIPVNLVATSGDGIIRLTWDSVKDAGVPKKNENLAGYKVYRKLASDTGDHVYLGQVVGDTTMFEDNTVVNGETYSYVVTSIDNSL